MPVVVVVVAVVLTLSRKIKAVVTGQAPVTLELRNTPGKNTSKPNGPAGNTGNKAAGGTTPHTGPNPSARSDFTGTSAGSRHYSTGSTEGPLAVNTTLNSPSSVLCAPFRLPRCSSRTISSVTSSSLLSGEAGFALRTRAVPTFS